ncbi:dethiobiotin synthetase [Rhizomicrobium palustre]|uniref:ATP-dependent dethiobiotin synthetase BioD n=1 Tax=Rhizomicrobium palustre TaxID=189966 RepID=A0A846MWE9_9PROT|nr:dethiobiotin synthase [Rhizomicrobium palustre]NIK87317.1 dethiobiotin synthetase [Rhizomicrobium palustre]
MSGIFITATGTGIGKTFITSGLLRYLNANGRPAEGFKPVMSGYEGPAGSDAASLLEAMGKMPTDDAVAEISAFRFKAPLSPDMAALAENRCIDFSALTQFCHQAASRSGTVLIEGVGGVMVPLDTEHTVLDLMALLRLPVVLVAGSYLGSLSHTLTAAVALKAAGLTTVTVVVNEAGAGPDAPAIPLADTAASLHRFLPEFEVVTLPRNPQDMDFAPVASAIFRESDKTAAAVTD